MPLSDKGVILSRIAELRNQAEKINRELGELAVAVESFGGEYEEQSYEEDPFLAEPMDFHREPPRRGQVTCKCGDAAVLKTLTSKKTGNPYDVYVCAKPRGEQCDTFEFPKR